MSNTTNAISSNEERLMTVVLGPHLSEKTTRVGDQNNQVVFKVRRDANKSEIRAAVEKMFEVKVTGVRVINVQGKATGSKLTRHKGRRNHWKKAYVSLAEGNDIDFLGKE
ncbi:MAG: 50S ribosomal protein L23 [Gammaproteobacteria bacterium]|nr:50S ribosomal protein L23 [Gammaproteobacteria bacterium]